MIQVVQVCDLIFILLGCIMVVTIPVSHSLRFELQSGHSKCIFEEIKGDSMSVGKYSIANPNEEAHHSLPNTYNVSVRTASTLGVEYHTAEQVQSGQFAFTAVEGGDYMTCFRAPEHHTTPTTLTIEFEWKTGIAAMDWSTVAKKGQVDVMELELTKLQDRISSIHDEMFYLREREEEMQELNESTNTKMALLSFLSLFVCLSVAGLQLWHLKTFFQKKKII